MRVFIRKQKLTRKLFRVEKKGIELTTGVPSIPDDGRPISSSNSVPFPCDNEKNRNSEDEEMERRR